MWATAALRYRQTCSLCPHFDIWKTILFHGGVIDGSQMVDMPVRQLQVLAILFNIEYYFLPLKYLQIAFYYHLNILLHSIRQHTLHHTVPDTYTYPATSNRRRLSQRILICPSLRLEGSLSTGVRMRGQRWPSMNIGWSGLHWKLLWTRSRRQKRLLSSTFSPLT